MSSIPPSVASTVARQSPDSTRFITNKMCPYAQKAWIALEASKTPYTMEEISLYGPNGKPSWFLDLNPEGTVPVLVCYGGAVILPDSEVILDFISDEGGVGGGNSLMPTNKDLVNEWRDAILTRVVPVGKAAVLKGKKKELFQLLKEIDGDVVGPFLCGEDVSVADCAAFPFLWRIDREFGPLDKGDGCENLRNWIDFCEGQDAFKKTVQDSWWWWW